ncbi:hypothetical protein BJP34_19255 [Moorena producens PAL-8-15-08-1]|uniref:LamG-like jellyroll fold domain-containing protein n=1 Tax=Moorena producens PAL-8-15-08-1 TaxID=1458985 RepID=A0A1D8TUG2_9CYAN|nr:hypothetical protein [Moorena producens]AOX01289.1 hypothetical protein BJP34_19255 [Moorena producens PAL-8-15-08-1]
MLAYGFITLLSLGSEYYFKYEIDAEAGFQIYWITIPEGLDKERYSKQTISEFLAESSVAQILKPGETLDKSLYQASLILPGLPASPFDAFYTIELTYNSDSFTLGVQSTDSFGFSPEGSTHFKDLNLSFTQPLNSETATVSGTVTAVFSGQDIVLEAGLSDGSELIFNYNPNNPQEIPIQPWGNLELTTFTVKPGSNPLQPQVLYWFGEKSGEWVYDCSLRNSEDAPAIDLRIQTEPETVQWGLGSIAVKDGLIESENATLEAANLSSASKLIKAFQESNEITIATWIKPSKTGQKYPAIVVTLSEDPKNPYVTLAQGDSEWLKDYGNPWSGDCYHHDEYSVLLLRTNTNDRNRYWQILTTSPDTVTTDELTYVVYTFSQNNLGDESDNAKLYLNGKLDNSKWINSDNQERHFWRNRNQQSNPSRNRNQRGNRWENRDDEDNRWKNRDDEEDSPWKDRDDQELNSWTNHPAVKLALANDVLFLERRGNFPRNEDFPWEGELYEVAIYDSALTPEAIYQRYYPTIEILGNLTLTNMPSPLNQPLIAQLTLEGMPDVEHYSESKLNLKVDISEIREVTPEFDFTKIALEWQSEPGSSPSWYFKWGQVDSTLWKTSIPFTAVQADAPGKLALNSPEFDFQIGLGQINTLEGLSLFLKPDSTGEIWQMSSITSVSELVLPQLRDYRPFDWTVDFKLLFARHNQQRSQFDPLGIEDGKVVLKGNWLGENLVLHGWWRNEQFVLEGQRNLTLPFEVTLGPIFEPGTSQKIIDQVAIASVMNATVILELTELGFLAKVSGTFDWTDQAGTVNTFTVPEFTLVRPPLTPNHILEAILARLNSEVDVIFAQQFRHQADYYFTEVEEKPVIYLGNGNDSAGITQTTTLPQLFNTAADSNNISSTTGIFTLTENADQSCTLTITPPESTENWLDQLKTDYDNFIAQLDTNSNLIAGTLTLVKTRIAERMPLLVEEILYYYYGLDSVNGSVDLQAGMRLQVDYQNYQFVHPAQYTANSGFVGSGTSYYSLKSYRDGTNLMINFDGFLSQIQPYVTTDIATVGAGSSLDTFKVGYQKPYLRLVYPSLAAPSAGSLDPEQAATIMGATTVTDLDKKTNVASFYFRGRATVIPEITVVLQEQPVFVPVGTTLRQLMEQHVSIPSVSLGESLLNSTGKPRLSRLLHEGVSNEPSYRFIYLDENSLVLDLPLVKGDRIVL